MALVLKYVIAYVNKQWFSALFGSTDHFFLWLLVDNGVCVKNYPIVFASICNKHKQKLTN